MFLDIIFCTAILTVYGWRSPFTVYAFSSVVLAAYHNKISWSFLIAALGAAGYVLSVAINGYTWAQLSRLGWLDSHLFQIFDYFFVALFFSYPAALADRLQKANQQLQASQKQIQDLTLAKERQRIAADIHDGIMQQIYGLRLLLEAVIKEHSANKELKEQLTKAKELTVKTASDLRVVIEDLFQDNLAVLPLGKLAYKIVNEYAGTYGLTIELDLKNYDKKLNNNSKKEVYLILQEALTNIVKHAQAKKVKVVMESVADKLFISVADDGVGFDAAVQSGHGLETIEQRVNRLGGSWRISSQANQGTTLTVVIPLVGAERSLEMSDTRPSSFIPGV